MASEAYWRGLVLALSIPLTIASAMFFATGLASSYSAVAPAFPIAILGLLLVVFCGARLENRVLLALLILSAVCLGYRVRDPDPAGLQNEVNWQNYVKVGTWSCLIVISAVNWRRTIRFMLRPHMAAFTVFVLLSVFSATWSVVPMVSLASASGLLAYLLFGCLITDSLPIETIIRTLVWGLGVWCLANWVAIVDPSLALANTEIDAATPRLQGLAGHPNLLATQMAIFLCLLFGAYSRKYIGRRSFYALVVLGGATLVATQSRTAILALVLGLFAANRRYTMCFLCLAVLVVLSFIIMTGQYAHLEAMLVRSGDQDMLAGRGEVWDYAQWKISERPLLGYGFNSFAITMDQDVNINPLVAEIAIPDHPHNNLLSVLFSGGILTLLPFVVCLLLMLSRYLTSPDALRDIYTLFLAFSSFTEVNIGGLPGLGTLVLVILMAADAPPRASMPIQLAANRSSRLDTATSA